ncbi:MAG: hypothetical protein QM737_15055 [Ferruginibacter sp.]
MRKKSEDSTSRQISRDVISPDNYEILEYTLDTNHLNFNERNFAFFIFEMNECSKKLKGDLQEADFEDIFQESVIALLKAVTKGLRLRTHSTTVAKRYFIRIFKNRKNDFFNIKNRQGSEQILQDKNDIIQPDISISSEDITNALLKVLPYFPGTLSAGEVNVLKKYGNNFKDEEEIAKELEITEFRLMKKRSRITVKLRSLNANTPEFWNKIVEAIEK